MLRYFKPQPCPSIYIFNLQRIFSYPKLNSAYIGKMCGMQKQESMKKTLILLFTFCVNSFLFPQTSAIKDTIALESVIVKTRPITKKTVTFETTGRPAYNGLEQTKKIVSLQKNLPKGTIKTVTFHFNCGLVNLLHKKLNIIYKDVKLGLLLYKVSTDGSPGEVISENEIEFVVNADHRGAYEVSLEKLNLESQDMYLGFELLTEMPKDENNIYVRFDESDDARCFVIFQGRDGSLNDKWFPFINYNFKSEIKIEQIK
jgi:hypothetical protein